MQNYRKTSHARYDCKYHIVWITKHRKKVLGGKVGKRVRELVREVCKRTDVEILKGHVSRDHVHLFVSVHPDLAISKLVQYLKCKGSYKLMQENEQVSLPFWGRGYVLYTSGNITYEMIMKYIESQDDHQKDDGEFTMVEWL